jgi:hypothetical protein
VVHWVAASSLVRLSLLSLVLARLEAICLLLLFKLLTVRGVELSEGIVVAPSALYGTVAVGSFPSVSRMIGRSRASPG